EPGSTGAAARYRFAPRRLRLRRAAQERKKGTNIDGSSFELPGHGDPSNDSSSTPRPRQFFEGKPAIMSNERRSRASSAPLIQREADTRIGALLDHFAQEDARLEAPSLDGFDGLA